jgi:hypothetical protein
VWTGQAKESFCQRGGRHTTTITTLEQRPNENHLLDVAKNEDSRSKEGGNEVKKGIIITILHHHHAASHDGPRFHPGFDVPVGTQGP